MLQKFRLVVEKTRVSKNRYERLKSYVLYGDRPNLKYKTLSFAKIYPGRSYYRVKLELDEKSKYKHVCQAMVAEIPLKDLLKDVEETFKLEHDRWKKGVQPRLLASEAGLSTIEALERDIEAWERRKFGS